MKNLTINGKSDLSFYGLQRNTFDEGEKVEFSLPFMTDCNMYVTSNATRIERNCEGGTIKCSFIMPDKDVSVDVSFENNMMNKNRSPLTFMSMGGFMAGGMTFTQCEPRKCPVCGEINTHRYTFCTECGSKLGTGDAKR